MQRPTLPHRRVPATRSHAQGPCWPATPPSPAAKPNHTSLTAVGRSVVGAVGSHAPNRVQSLTRTLHVRIRAGGGGGRRGQTSVTSVPRVLSSGEAVARIAAHSGAPASNRCHALRPWSTTRTSPAGGSRRVRTSGFGVGVEGLGVQQGMVRTLTDTPETALTTNSMLHRLPWGVPFRRTVEERTEEEQSGQRQRGAWPKALVFITSPKLFS